MGKQVADELAQLVKPIKVLSDATPAVFKKITGLPNPEPYVAEFPLPPPSSLERARRLLVIDQINDPGNLGTLLRTALALGWDGVYFLSGSVDPFNDKVLRASKGALFRLCYRMGSIEELKTLATSFAPFVADLEGTAIGSFAPPPNPLLVLSNEARGVDGHFEHFGTKLTIPIKTMESLNVAIAGSILMYELCQKTI